ncbi:MAG TPA: YggS family pyridoxal phosphate-dependent enzyme [Candidatus Acidoferrales bacterium]
MGEALSMLAANLAQIKERVARAAQRAGRRAEEITIVAVTKTHPAETILAAYEAGLRHFGENRVQEFEGKVPSLAKLEATWHLIGHLQSNKSARAARLFNRIDSVDSLTLAQRLDAAAAAENKKLGVLIEVHLSDETTKSGVSEAELPELAESVATFPNLQLHGLMTIPPFLDNPEDVRPFFRRLAEIREKVSRRIAKPLHVLSMGMSHDFEVAIEEGATEIRPGTALFGARPAKIAGDDSAGVAGG